MPVPLRIIFAGTPEFAAVALQALLDTQHQVIAVYTQPDRPAGRGRKLRASPVKELALAHDLPVYQPESLKGEAEQLQLSDLNADLMIVAAYGLILPQAVLDIPQHGCLNIHASLLPRWRGAAPIQRAILAGDSETGITIMQMDAGLDTGAMLLKKSLPIDPLDTGGSLHDKLAVLGGDALLETLEALQLEQLQPEAQDSALACYAHKLEKAEACIDWQQPAEQIHRLIRAFNPWPVAFTEFAEKNIRVWSAEPTPLQGTPGKVLQADRNGLVVACGKDSLSLLTLQPAGSKPMDARSFINGNADWFSPGIQLGEA